MFVRRDHAEYDDLGYLHQYSKAHEAHGRSNPPLFPCRYVRDLTDNPPRITRQDDVANQGVKSAAEVKPSCDMHRNTPAGYMREVELSVANIQPCQDEEGQVEGIGQHHDQPQEPLAPPTRGQSKQSDGECGLAQGDRAVHEADSGEVDCLATRASVENVEAVRGACCTESI